VVAGAKHQKLAELCRHGLQKGLACLKSLKPNGCVGLPVLFFRLRRKTFQNSFILRALQTGSRVFVSGLNANIYVTSGTLQMVVWHGKR
jgi:hypothetical protein